MSFARRTCWTSRPPSALSFEPLCPAALFPESRLGRYRHRGPSLWVCCRSAALLYYSLRGIAWRQVWILISGAKPAYLALLVRPRHRRMPPRAMRWRILPVRAEGDVGVSAAFWATSAGCSRNNFLPARAGELVRTFMISARSGLSKTYVLTTALSERVADAVALVVISALALLTLPAQPGWLAHAAKPFAVLGLCGVAAIAVLPRLHNRGKALLERLPMPHGLRAKLMVMLEHILRGIRAFHDSRRLLGFLGLTIVIWSTDAVGSMIGAKLWACPWRCR